MSVERAGISFKVASSSDWHVRSGRGSELSHAMVDQVVASMVASSPDMVLLGGDLTDNGTIASTRMVAMSLRPLRDAHIPTFVLHGNHDYPKGVDPREVRSALEGTKKIYKEYGGVRVLDKSSAIVKKVVEGKVWQLGILGITGGYDSSLYVPPAKNAHQAGKIRGQDLEKSLTALKKYLRETKLVDNIILMHFAPSAVNLQKPSHPATLVAGSRRFEDVIRAYERKVRAVFHGHVHSANRLGKVGEVDVICSAMQVGLGGRDMGVRRPKQPHEFYYLHDIVCQENK